MSRDDIIELGKKAYRDGNPCQMNPFVNDDSAEGEDNWAAWTYGWRKAKSEDPEASKDHVYDPDEDIPCDVGPQL